MTEHQLTKVELEDAISRGHLDEVCIAEMDCRAVEWGSTVVKHSEFRNVHFGSVAFSETRLDSVHFTGVVLRGVKGPRIQSGVRYEDSDMAESNWVNGELKAVAVAG